MPEISFPMILTIDQSRAVARYLNGQAPKPSDLPKGYILPNGEPAYMAPESQATLIAASNGKRLPTWAWLAMAAAGVLLVLAIRKRGA